jgi:hypothetical protein
MGHGPLSSCTIFLRCRNRKKDGKGDRYWNVVETEGFWVEESFSGRTWGDERLSALDMAQDDRGFEWKREREEGNVGSKTF